jgi:hypothetical protein
MHRHRSKPRSNFAMGEVFPPLGFTNPFPTVCPVNDSALAAQQFHITTAY